MQKLTKILSIAISSITLGGALSFGLAANAQAIIPQHMQPGSIIKIDDSGSIDILSGGYASDKSAADQLVLPKPEPGMRIAYDGMGDPTKVVNEKTDQEYSVKPADKTIISASSAIRLTSHASRTGWVTWYTDTIGQGDHVLQNYDCATKLSVDNCRLGTPVTLNDLTNGRTVTLYKWDVGSLPNAVLDIRTYVFSNVLGHSLNAGHFQGNYTHS